MILIASMVLAMLVLIQNVLTLLFIIEQLECKPATAMAMEIVTHRQQHSSIRTRTSNCKMGSRISKQHPFITTDVQANEERAKYRRP